MEATIDRHSYLNHFIGLSFFLMAMGDILYSRELIGSSALLSISAFLFCFPIKNRNFFSESMLFILFLLITSLVNLFFTQNNFGGSLTLLGNLFLAFLYFQGDNKKLTLWIVASYLITILMSHQQ